MPEFPSILSGAVFSSAFPFAFFLQICLRDSRPSLPGILFPGFPLIGVFYLDDVATSGLSATAASVLCFYFFSKGISFPEGSPGSYLSIYSSLERIFGPFPFYA